MRLSSVSRSQLGLVLILKLCIISGIACRGAQSKSPNSPGVSSPNKDAATRTGTRIHSRTPPADHGSWCCFTSSPTVTTLNRNGNAPPPFVLRMTSSPFNSNTSSTPIPPPPPISVPVYSLAAPLRNGIGTNPSSSNSDDETIHGILDDTNEKKKQQEGTTNTTSMNIVTFCTPISVAPPKLWTVSLYTNTLTKMAFISSGIGVLQLLSNHQSSLVSILGKHSGHDESYSKQDQCALVGFPWVLGGGVVEQDVGEYHDGDGDGDNKKMNTSSFEDIHLLPQCESYLKLKLIQTVEAGDHDLALCQVIDVGHWSEEFQSVVSINSIGMEDGHDHHQKPKDESEVLYTGQLRKESII